ncbi:MLO protein homolog 1-like [Ipomoea triloba]|uniref:MLO protein homolog 1-like n=1 Tax=Ipomoea triloba TaxID=35885 RepID=UPI00125D6506|nr:MLO protein homolog 1-like [Ipomoea triloba]
MAGGGGGGDSQTLQETPTWALAAVCGVFIAISIVIEQGIHKLGEWFKKKQKKAMMEALEKIKAELMLLGFISLLLTVSTTLVARICIPPHFAHTWLPCPHDSYNRHRLLLSFNVTGDVLHRRFLAGVDDEKDYCGSRGKTSLISYAGVHQLHIFIFVLAVMHIVYSVVLVLLGQLKMRRWKTWELETSSLEYELSYDPSRFRYVHQTSFVRRHSGLSTIPGIKWIVAFFRQFSGSISKVDYLTIRNGFIKAHFAPNAKFNFYKYIKRSMEDDYKRVLGISLPLWISATIFLLVNIHKWHIIAWIALAPVVILVLTGTKLELVIMEMAQQIQDKTNVVRGAPIVEPTNDFFWFSKPHLILFLIHFSLFENAFQMAYFLWSLWQFGITSCVHDNIYSIVLRVCLGVILHVLCSYITFPHYALVTQMGSHMKTAIFEEQTAKAVKKWQKEAKQRQKKRSSPTSPSPQNTSTSRDSSPSYLLHNLNNSSSAHPPMGYCFPLSPTRS